MTATFECFQDDIGARRFCLRADDGDPVPWSTAFPSITACREAIASARRNCRIAERFDVHAAGRRRFQFTLKRANGQVLGRSRYYPAESVCFSRLIHVGRAASGPTVMEVTTARGREPRTKKAGPLPDRPPVLPVLTAPSASAARRGSR